MAKRRLAVALVAALLGGTATLAETVVFNEGLGSGKKGFAAVIAALKPDVPVFFEPRPKVMAGMRMGDAARRMWHMICMPGWRPPMWHRPI